MTEELHTLTAAELSKAYAAKELSPVDVAEYALGRIEALDATINSFCLIDGERAMEQAAESEARWMSGAPLSPLDGVPTGVKDLLLTKGWPTLRGSRAVDPNQKWAEDAPSVARMRAAGMVLLGKHTTPEFGHKAVTDSPLTGVTRNPWNHETTPGGSSGGTSAAIAAGFCPVAPGTDAGGSIRIPSGLTALVGLKPTFGRVPAYPPSVFGTLAHAGPMSRTVHDAALLMNEIAKPDPRDGAAIAYDARDYVQGLEGGVKGARIAFSPRLGHVPHVDPEVEAAVAKAARSFEQLGATVEQVDPPGGDVLADFLVLFFAGAAAALAPFSAEKRALVDPGLQEMAGRGEKLSALDYLGAVGRRNAYASQMRVFMELYDFVLTPTTAAPAFRAGQNAPVLADGSAWWGWAPFCFPFNMTQQPAVSVNCGFTAAGLPIGLQIVGRMWDDAGVLRAARAFEAAQPAITWPS